MDEQEHDPVGADRARESEERAGVGQSQPDPNIRKLSIEEEVSLALRAARRQRGESQRELARAFGWSQSHVSRLETSAESLKLGQVQEALLLTGWSLLVVDAFGNRPESVCPQTDLVARDRGGARFPAHRAVHPCPEGPWWWWEQEFIRLSRPLGPQPQWTTVVHDLMGCRDPAHEHPGRRRVV